MLSVCLHFSIMVAAVLLYTAFIISWYDASTPNVSRTFMLNFVKCFSGISWDDYAVLPLSAYIIHSIYWFTYIESTLPRQGEAHLNICVLDFSLKLFDWELWHLCSPNKLIFCFLYSLYFLCGMIPKCYLLHKRNLVIFLPVLFCGTN